MTNWSTLQLTEFFSAISRAGDVAGAATCAAEQAAEATEAEIAVVVDDGVVVAGLGLGRGADCGVFPTLGPAADRVPIGRLGEFWCSVQPMGEAYPGTLIVARAEEAFAPEERQMLQGMARVLGLALRGLQTLAAERGLRIDQERSTAALEKRERLLENLLLIQRAANQRAPLQDVLDSVTRAAGHFLDGAEVALVLRDDDATLVASSTAGSRTGPDFVQAADRAARLAGIAVHGPLLAAPVYSSGEVAGGLVAGPSPDSVAPQERRDLLAAFAEQASLALTGAHTVAAVRQAYHDGLTGLPNRTLFLERLERALGAGTAVAVLYLDLDLFKQVNDSLGHAAGDDLLRGVAGRLRECVRAGDMTARLGGDEFAILLEPAGGEQARAIAERVIAAVAAPFVIAGQDVTTRASIGIALSGAGTGTGTGTGASLVEDADVAMYRAKKSRPGTWLLFEPAMRTALIQQITLITDAERALAGGEFELAYQPIVRLADAAPLAVEALLRWTHPALGPVPPATFVPLAEKNGFIGELGRWVLGEACRTWRTGLPGGFGLNVNVSGRQLEDPRFAADVAGILTLFGVPPAVLTLEFTETALAGDPRQARRRILELRELGVRVSIDDFGAGFTSLAHLVEFPIDQIKIDKSFVDGLPHDRRRLAVVRSVLTLGATLDLQTVAEGVEEPAQLEALRSLGCVAAQGFLFARPMTADALTAYVAAQTADRVRTA
jgi:diguanylate cyclase (GGDEF)-like protein